MVETGLRLLHFVEYWLLRIFSFLSSEIVFILSIFLLVLFVLRTSGVWGYEQVQLGDGLGGDGVA